MIKIIEIFKSVQGEGSHVGEPSTFIRVAGCNLRCTDCDSKYSWEVGAEMSISEISKIVDANSTLNVVITGGEPTCQPEVFDLCKELQNRHYIVSVQTNGTQWAQLLTVADYVMMDAKPGHINTTLISKLNPNIDEIKVLVGDEDDLRFAQSVNHKASYFDVLTIIQVKNDCERDTYEDLIKKYIWLTEQKFISPVRILPQLHVLIWGNKRGV